MLRPISSQTLALREVIDKPEKVLDTYYECYNEVFEVDEAMRLVFRGHVQNSSWTREHTEAFLKVLNKHSECLSYMASKFPAFQSDNPAVRQRNATLYKYYIMARYFTAQTAQMQGFSQLGNNIQLFCDWCSLIFYSLYRLDYRLQGW